MNKYSKMVDVYSFGIILWESMELRCPWCHDERFRVGAFQGKIMTAVENDERPPMTKERIETAPKGFDALIMRCWDKDPDVRPRFLNILHELQDMELEIAERDESKRKKRLVPKGSLVFRGFATYDVGVRSSVEEGNGSVQRLHRRSASDIYDAMSDRKRSDLRDAKVVNVFELSQMRPVENVIAPSHSEAASKVRGGSNGESGGVGENSV